MKKVYSNLWRVAGKAVLALALATPVLVTSCEKFDDSQLKQEISDINDELDKINERIDKLEKDLSAKISSLNEMIKGQVTVASCTTDAEGKTTVVLSDGSQFIVYPESKPLDLSGITYITTIAEDGALYWASCTVGGTPEALLDNGKKVPVSVQPDLKIEDGKWYISVDGGKTWIETGIEEEKAEEVVVFFSNVKEDEDYVYLTLVSGTEIKVAKDKDVAFSAPFGKQYFAYGETKSLALEMVGVKNYTITEKPEGWKVSIKSKKISITAPAEENTSADASGVIKVLATFDNASPVIASIPVSTEEADFVLSLEGDQVSFTLAEKNVGNESYNGFVYGVMPKDEFTPAAAIAYFKTEYKWGAAAWDSTTLSIDKLVTMVGGNYDPEVSYVVFAANYANSYWGDDYSEDDLQYLVYVPVKVNVDITPSLENANLKFSFSGIEAVYGGIESADYFDKGQILMYLNWGDSYTPVTDAYDGPIGLFAGGFDSTLQIGKDYVFWYLIKNDTGVYTEDDVKTEPFSTFPLVTGGSLAAPEIQVGDVTKGSVSATVSVVEGCYKTYACIFVQGSYTYPKDEADRISKMTTYGTGRTEGTISLSNNSLQPGSKVEICAMAVDANGNVGSIAQVDITTPSLVFSDDLKVSVENVEVFPTSAKVKLALTGDVSKISYVLRTYAGSDTMENDIALGNPYDLTEVNVSELTDNTLELTDLNFGTEYYFYVMAFDANGACSHMNKTTFTPESDIVYIKKSADNWAYGKPSFSNDVIGGPGWIWRSNWNGDYAWYSQSEDLTIDITLPAECKKAYVAKADDSYFSTDSEMGASDKILFYPYLFAKEITESGTYTFESLNNESSLYVVWVDDNDQYHTYDVYKPTWPEMPTEAPSEPEE